MRPVSYVLGLLAASTLLMWVDHSPSDVANQAAMLVLVVSAAALGFAAPRWARLSALVLGGCLAVTHVIYLAAGVALRDVADWLGWPGYIADLDHSGWHCRLSRSGRGRAGATAAVVRSRMTSDSG
jgi:hypothetical protein